MTTPESYGTPGAFVPSPAKPRSAFQGRTRTRSIAMRLPTLALTTLVLAACAGDPGVVTPGEGPVRLRLENATGGVIDSATAWTLDGPRRFGRLLPGGSSAYTAVSAAYRFVTIDAFFPDTTLRLQVIDYVGESTLPPGRYTYILSLFEDTSGERWLGLDFRED